MKVFGVSTEFTEEQIERLEYCAGLRNFAPKSYVNDLKGLTKK